MENFDDRLLLVEQKLRSMQEAREKWILSHDENRRTSDKELYNLINQLSDKVDKYINLNLTHEERINTIKAEQTTIRQQSVFHEKSITQFEIYLKDILTELQMVGLVTMKSDIDNLHEKHRESENCINQLKENITENISTIKNQNEKEFGLIHRDLEAIKNKSGLIAKKAWVWAGSTIGIATITGLITWLLTRNPS